MRLKTKILLCICAFIIAAVTLCCVLILRVVRDQMQQDALSKAEEDFSESQSQILRAWVIPNDSVVSDVYLAYQVRRCSFSSELTLSDGDRYLINNTGFSPEPFVFQSEYDPENAIQSCCTHVFGALYVMVGEPYELYGSTYRICLVRNVSALDTTLSRLATRCAIIGAAVTCIFLLLSYLLLTLSFQPIKTLQTGARAIAEGDYSMHIPVRRKDEIGRLSDDFNSMARAVEESIALLKEQNARKQQFINDLSHEMKTPVTSLLINSETLITRNVSVQDAKRVYSRIHEQAQWIERLSQKLMQLVILQGQIDLVPCPVLPLFEAVQETVRDSLSSADVSLRIQCGSERFPMDFDLMQSALVNVVENAIKASSPNSVIELIANRDAILVKDHGRGIPKEEIERITEPFYMVDRSRSKKLGGSGLGLALVKRIAELHHAELIIESELNVGTSIFFRFSYAV